MDTGTQNQSQDFPSGQLQLIYFLTLRFAINIILALLSLQIDNLRSWAHEGTWLPVRAHNPKLLVQIEVRPLPDGLSFEHAKCCSYAPGPEYQGYCCGGTNRAEGQLSVSASPSRPNLRVEFPLHSAPGPRPASSIRQSTRLIRNWGGSRFESSAGRVGDRRIHGRTPVALARVS